MKFENSVAQSGATSTSILGTTTEWWFNSDIQTSTKVSSTTPGFLSKKRSELPFNPYTQTYRRETRSNGLFGGWTATGAYYGWSGNCFPAASQWGLQPLPYASADEAERQALYRLFDRLKDSKVNLAQAFAERKQTVSLLSSSVNRLASAALAIRRGNLKHALNLFGQPYNGKLLKREIKPSRDNLANYWLEYSFGWRPLLGDIYGSAELIADTFIRSPKTSVSATGSCTRRESDYVLGQAYVGTGSKDNFEHAISISERVVRYVIEFEVDSYTQQTLSATGITDPATLAWELVPYSFVVDWFLPVGDYLSALSATRGLAFKRGTRSVRSSLTMSTNWKQHGEVTNNDFFVRSGMGREIVEMSKVRTVLTSFPSIPLPVLQPSDKLVHALHSLALLQGLLSPKKIRVR